MDEDLFLTIAELGRAATQEAVQQEEVDSEETISESIAVEEAFNEEMAGQALSDLQSSEPRTREEISGAHEQHTSEDTPMDSRPKPRAESRETPSADKSSAEVADKRATPEEEEESTEEGNEEQGEESSSDQDTRQGSPSDPRAEASTSEASQEDTPDSPPAPNQGRTRRIERKPSQKRHTEHSEVSASCPIIAGKIFCPLALAQLHLAAEFWSLVDAIGWRCFFEADLPTYDCLLREFYNDFDFSPETPLRIDSGETIFFRFGRRVSRMSLNEFNEALGFVAESDFNSREYVDSLCSFPEDFNANEFYREITESRAKFDPSKSKANLIISPVLRYIHRLLAFSYSGRRNASTIISKTELFFLWAMLTRRRVNLGYWVAAQISAARASSRGMIMGHLVSKIACSVGALDLTNPPQTTTVAIPPLDMSTLDNMGLIIEVGEGNFVMVDAGQTVPKQDRTYQHPRPPAPAIAAEPQPRPAPQTYASSSRELVTRVTALETQVTAIQDMVSTLGTKLDNIEGLLLDLLSRQPPPP